MIYNYHKLGQDFKVELNADTMNISKCNKCSDDGLNPGHKLFYIGWIHVACKCDLLAVEAGVQILFRHISSLLPGLICNTPSCISPLRNINKKHHQAPQLTSPPQCSLFFSHPTRRGNKTLMCVCGGATGRLHFCLETHVTSGGCGGKTESQFLLVPQ